MNCPKCNKKMKPMCYLGTTALSDGTRNTKVLGRCADCDFDATWDRTICPSGEIKEGKVQKYFFG